MGALLPDIYWGEVGAVPLQNGTPKESVLGI